MEGTFSRHPRHGDECTFSSSNFGFAITQNWPKFICKFAKSFRNFKFLHEGPHFLQNLKVEKYIIFEQKIQMCKLLKG